MVSWALEQPERLRSHDYKLKCHAQKQSAPTVSVNSDANPLYLQTIIGGKWLEVMKTDPGTCHFYKRKKLEYNKEIESLKAQLESNEVGCLSDKLLPNGWKVRRVQGEGKIYFLSPHPVSILF